MYRKRRHQVEIRAALTLIFCTSPSQCFPSIIFSQLYPTNFYHLPILPLHEDTWMHILQKEKFFFLEHEHFPQESRNLDVLPCTHREAVKVLSLPNPVENYQEEEQHTTPSPMCLKGEIPTFTEDRFVTSPELQPSLTMFCDNVANDVIGIINDVSPTVDTDALL